jgi:tetratricopeptide (TPR) repeat protein
MKQITAILILFSVAGILCARAQQSADSQYVNLYGQIQRADGLASSGDLRQALAEYTSAQTQLQQFQYAFPDWNPKIITFRLKYLAGKINDLNVQLKPIPLAAASTAPPVLKSDAATGSPAIAPAAGDSELATLRGQLEASQWENTTLLAKLKEALSVQPAPADAGALARAQEQVRSLMKENDLLKAGAAAAHADATMDTNALPALQDENARLKSQLAALASSVTNASIAGQQEINQARQQIAAMQSEAQVRQLENAALENRLRQLQTNAPAPAQQTNATAPIQQENEARIRELTQERDDLLAKLGDANKRFYGSTKAALEVQIDLLTDQVRTLRERLAVAEGQPSPYTPEELALLKPADPQLATGEGQKKSIKQLPADSAGLVAEAQGFFSAKEYDRAEADYLKILEQDPDNSLVLGNLATIEMQENKLDDAEKHIKAALAQDPNDAFNLTTLGHLKFQQGKYDEALDVLSRAAKLDPQNPEIQNYLGVTLASKGLRSQAEAALRRAVELNPNYADAQKNLAAIYISATPPLVELARWHYQKALEDGQPHDPGLEKALAEKSAPVVP